MQKEKFNGNNKHTRQDITKVHVDGGYDTNKYSSRTRCSNQQDKANSQNCFTKAIVFKHFSESKRHDRLAYGRVEVC
jgi:hypothetical protein